MKTTNEIKIEGIREAIEQTELCNPTVLEGFEETERVCLVDDLEEYMRKLSK